MIRKGKKAKRSSFILIFFVAVIIYILIAHMTTKCGTACHNIFYWTPLWDTQQKIRHDDVSVLLQTPNILKADSRQDNGEAVCSNDIRRNNIEDFCNGLIGNTTLPHRIPQLKVIDRYQLLYCEIPKVGSTSMKTLLARILTSDENWKYNFSKVYTDETGIRHFHLLEEEEREFLLMNYRKVVVLRHPLDRLRSAYYEKIQPTDSDSAHNIRVEYTDVIRDYLVEKGLVTKDTFKLHSDILHMEQFFDIVSRNLSDFSNWHWLPYWQLCDPCAVKYDFVMKLETLEKDIEVLHSYLRRINSSVILPKVVHTHRLEHSTLTKMDLVSRMMRTNISLDVRKRIIEYETRDFHWAGYNWDITDGAVCRTGSYLCC